MFSSNVTVPQSCRKFYFCCTSAVRARHLKSEPLQGLCLRDIDHLLQLFVCFQFPLQPAGEEALCTLQDQARRGCSWTRLADLSSDGSMCYWTSQVFLLSAEGRTMSALSGLELKIVKWEQARVMDFSFFENLHVRLHFRILPILRRDVFSRNFGVLVIFFCLIVKAS